MLTFQFCLQLGTHYYPNYISGFQEKSVLTFEKNEIFFKTSFPTTKIYDDGLHYVTKNMKVDLKLKKTKHNTEFETVFGFSVFKYCALCVSYLTTNFSDSHP